MGHPLCVKGKERRHEYCYFYKCIVLSFEDY